MSELIDIPGVGVVGQSFEVHQGPDPYRVIEEQSAVAQQQDKCLRGEHEAVYAPNALSADQVNRGQRFCGHCRCLYVERP